MKIPPVILELIRRGQYEKAIIESSLLGSASLKAASLLEIANSLNEMEFRSVPDRHLPKIAVELFKLEKPEESAKVFGMIRSQRSREKVSKELPGLFRVEDEFVASTV